MHGQRRPPPGAENEAWFAEKLKQRNAKASKANAAVKAVLKARATGNYGPAVMLGTKAVLPVFPDFFSLWNVRREALQQQLSAEGADAKQIMAQELALVQGCLAEHPKSYAAWHHRKWVVDRGHCDLAGELKSVEDFLHPTRGDAKNVHAWRYRYFLVARMPRSDEDELAYCQALIAADRSNFSAWHYRSVLLPRVHAARGHLSLEQLQLGGGAGQDVAQEGVGADMQSPGTGASADTKAQRQEIVHKDEQSSAEQRAKETRPAPTAAAERAAPSIPLYELKAEFEFLHQTLAVTPGDASAWSYHRWLAHTTVQHATCSPPASDDTRSEVRTLLDIEESRCEELIAAERRRAAEDASALTEGGALQSGLVWPQQMAAELSSLQRSLLREGAQCSERIERERGMFHRLIDLDPRRQGFYEDQLQALQASH